MSGASRYVRLFCNSLLLDLSVCPLIIGTWPGCRSPSIVVGYLMKHRRWRLLESFRWVKDRRPNISINPSKWLGCDSGWTAT